MTTTPSIHSPDTPVQVGLSEEFERRIASTRESIGLSLQRIRVARGLSCREIGRLAAFGPGTANKLEAHCTGTVDTFLRMVAALSLGNAVGRLFRHFELGEATSAAGTSAARVDEGALGGDVETQVAVLHVAVSAAMKAVRIARLVSQEEAARRSGVHVRTVWNIESRLAGTMNSLLRLAEAFDIASELQLLLEDRARTEPVVITPANKRFAALLCAVTGRADA